MQMPASPHYVAARALQRRDQVPQRSGKAHQELMMTCPAAQSGTAPVIIVAPRFRIPTFLESDGSVSGAENGRVLKARHWLEGTLRRR